MRIYFYLRNCFYCFFSNTYGGEGGIRTHDPVARIPVFETGTFNRSATSPEARILADSRTGVSRRG